MFDILSLARVLPVVVTRTISFKGVQQEEEEAG
jgi:hypothetical protein